MCTSVRPSFKSNRAVGFTNLTLSGAIASNGFQKQCSASVSLANCITQLVRLHRMYSMNFLSDWYNRFEAISFWKPSLSGLVCLLDPWSGILVRNEKVPNTWPTTLIFTKPIDHFSFWLPIDALLQFYFHFKRLSLYKLHFKIQQTSKHDAPLANTDSLLIWHVETGYLNRDMMQVWIIAKRWKQSIIDWCLEYLQQT